MNWLEGIAREDLFDDYRMMFDIIRLKVKSDEETIDIILGLSKYFSKQQFYFRSLRELESERKRRFIIERFNGANHAELARITDFSLQYVYEILAENRSRKQCGLFPSSP